jgi:hypothetical protein
MTLAHAQDLDLPSSPFPRRILLGCDSHFLAGVQAFWPAFAFLAGSNLWPKNDDGPGYLYPPQQAIAAFDEDPTRRRLLARGRVDDFALENALCPETPAADKHNQHSRQEHTHSHAG